jgi:hypothetical protein
VRPGLWQRPFGGAEGVRGGAVQVDRRGRPVVGEESAGEHRAGAEIGGPGPEPRPTRISAQVGDVQSAVLAEGLQTGAFVELVLELVECPSERAARLRADLSPCGEHRDPGVCAAGDHCDTGIEHASDDLVDAVSGMEMARHITHCGGEIDRGVRVGVGDVPARHLTTRSPGTPPSSRAA